VIMNVAYSQITKINHKFLRKKQFLQLLLQCGCVKESHSSSKYYAWKITEDYFINDDVFDCTGLNAPTKLLIPPRYMYRCVFCLGQNRPKCVATQL
jgi:hypothetical protein